MKYVYFLIAVFWGQVALAHPGHLAEVAGHGHWIGAAALGAAIAIGLWAGLKSRDREAQSEDVEDDKEKDAELQGT